MTVIAIALPKTITLAITIIILTPVCGIVSGLTVVSPPSELPTFVSDGVSCVTLSIVSLSSLLPVLITISESMIGFSFDGSTGLLANSSYLLNALIQIFESSIPRSIKSVQLVPFVEI